MTKINAVFGLLFLLGLLIPCVLSATENTTPIEIYNSRWEETFKPGQVYLSPEWDRYINLEVQSWMDRGNESRKNQKFWTAAHEYEMAMKILSSYDTATETVGSCYWGYYFAGECYDALGRFDLADIDYAAYNRLVGVIQDSRGYSPSGPIRVLG